MEKKIKIYLDTSVINFLFSEQSLEKREITLELFENFIKTGIYETFISDVVIAEILDTENEEKRKILFDVISKYPIKYVDISYSEEIVDLANQYLDENIIPKRNQADAYHIAISIVNNIDILISWNYKHLANINRKRKVFSVNIRNNYFQFFDILSPPELIDYENE